MSGVVEIAYVLEVVGFLVLQLVIHFLELLEAFGCLEQVIE